MVFKIFFQETQEHPAMSHNTMPGWVGCGAAAYGKGMVAGGSKGPSLRHSTFASLFLVNLCTVDRLINVLINRIF